MRVSMRQSPGYVGSSLTGIVLTYGVVVGPGTVMPAPRSRSVRLSRKNAACAGLWFFRIDSTTNSRLLNHLRVSSPPGLRASRCDAVHAAAALNIVVSLEFNFDLSVTSSSIPSRWNCCKERSTVRSATGASWKYHHGREHAGNVGQASRLPCRAERRGVRSTKASLRSAGQARRLPYVNGPGKMRPRYASTTAAP